MFKSLGFVRGAKTYLRATVEGRQWLAREWQDYFRKNENLNVYFCSHINRQSIQTIRSTSLVK